MGKINILSKAAAEKIAAGEVVERPANAIKEMVENSIDAGAKSVTVEIRRGGIAYIRVTDDGSGILPEDAERAFMRHATSKIKDETDLEHITTLGFRGEALCSIASVSRTDMLTKTAQSPMGTHIVVHGGEIIVNEEMGCADGTTVVVEDLFYNTPARMKFLKKDSAEAALVTEVCQRQALSRPDVSIRLVREGKEAFFTPGNNNLADAVRCLWGKDFSSNMSAVSYSVGGIKVSGLTGKNNLSRPSRAMQVFFVNGRSVINRTLSLALADAYKNELMGGRFPVAVLNVEIDPTLCDVNVHPTKTEIKFADEKAVYSALYWAVKNTLAAAAGAREVRPAFSRSGESYKQPFIKSEAEQLSVRPAGKFSKYSSPVEDKPRPAETKRDGELPLREDISPLLPKKPIERLETPVPSAKKDEPPRQQPTAIKAPVIAPEGEPENIQAPKTVSENKFIPAAAHENEPESINKPEAEPQAAPQAEPPQIRIIGQLFSTYILAEAEKELVLIDQHAAHERIRYEELRQNEEKVSMQMLMLPQSVALSPAEYQAVIENRDFLWDMGFDLEDVGGSSVLMRSTPADCPGSDGETLLSEMAAVLMGGAGGTVSERRDRAMYTLACKSAIKANRDLSDDEILRLVQRALSLEGISTCPHGRPISVKITKQQIEKMFKRIV